MGGFLAQYRLAHHLSHRWTVFKTMFRSASDQPYIFRVGVTIDYEITIGRVFARAYVAFNQRRVLHGRKAEVQILANVSEQIGRHRSVAIRRIEERTSRVVGDLESSPIGCGNAVYQTSLMISPDRKRSF